MKNCLIILLVVTNVLTTLTFYQPQKQNYYCDTYFFDGGISYTEESETIYFDNYTMTQTIISNNIPNYINLTQVNSCAPMAGTIILSYYDYNCPNIIPDYNTGYIYENVFYYRAQSAVINNLKEHMYELMGTNTVHAGTSLSQFKTGMNTYVNNQGYSIDYTNCGNLSNISIAINKLNEGVPLAVFINSYNYVPFAGYTINNTQMELNKRISSIGHVAVAYGYREYSFYKNGSIFRIDKYLLISFGNGTQGMLNISNLASIDYVLAIGIS